MSSKNATFGAYKPILGYFIGQNQNLSTHNLLRQKIATSCLSFFIRRCCCRCC